jgi:PhnB protein
LTQLNFYLTFNGNCREAMMFYRDCLGGALAFQTVGETPLSDRLPKQMKDCILHCTLTKENWILMGSDLVEESGLVRGNAISLALNCSNEKEMRKCYEKLSAGGQATIPIAHTFWGALFGGLVDKYGHFWLLSKEERKRKTRITGF